MVDVIGLELMKEELWWNVDIYYSLPTEAIFFINSLFL